jgi:hypothetical protein
MLLAVEVPPVAHELASAEMHAAFLVFAGFWVLVSVVWGLRIGWGRGWRRGNLLGALMVPAGCLAVVQEPFVDVLGKIFLADNTGLIAVDTIRRIPLSVLLVYGPFFGFLPYLWCRAFQRGCTRRTFWRFVAAQFVIDAAIEIVVIAHDQWFYYGDQAFVVAGFPLYWTTINTSGCCLVSAAVYFGHGWLQRGWRQFAVLPIPPMLIGGSSMATGLPLFSALYSPWGQGAVRVAGAVTIALGLGVIELVARLCCSDSPWRPRIDAATRPAGAAERQPVS